MVDEEMSVIIVVSQQPRTGVPGSCGTAIEFRLHPSVLFSAKALGCGVLGRVAAAQPVGVLAGQGGNGECNLPLDFFQVNGFPAAGSYCEYRGGAVLVAGERLCGQCSRLPGKL